MKMNEYLEKAQRKAGSQIKLAKTLGISDRYIRLVRDGERSLADDICIKLADYIKEDRLEVIAASNLVTEKDEEKRKIFESCFQKVASLAGIAIITLIVTISTGSPAHAGFGSSMVDNTNYTQLLYTFCGIVLLHLGVKNVFVDTGLRLTTHYG